jgi:hypothetical protein
MFETTGRPGSFRRLGADIPQKKAMASVLPAPVNNIAWVLGLIAGMGTIGKFIDWYIGKPGQAKVKDRLLQGWDKFTDMHWFNFSEVEARYVVAFMDRFVGEKFFSWKRLLIAAAVPVLAATIVVVAYTIKRPHCFYLDEEFFLPTEAAIFSIQVIGLMASFSFSRWLSMLVISIARRRALGPLAYCLLVVVHVLLLTFWTEISLVLVIDLASYVVAITAHNPDSIEELNDFAASTFRDWRFVSLRFQLIEIREFLFTPICPTGLTQLCSIAAMATAVFAGLWRIVTALTLIIAFVLREWLSHFVKNIWEKIYEDNEGAFTLIFGGLGAVAGGIKALMG